MAGSEYSREGHPHSARYLPADLRLLQPGPHQDPSGDVQTGPKTVQTALAPTVGCSVVVPPLSVLVHPVGGPKDSSGFLPPEAVGGNVGTGCAGSDVCTICMWVDAHHVQCTWTVD